MGAASVYLQDEQERQRKSPTGVQVIQPDGGGISDLNLPPSSPNPDYSGPGNDFPQGIPKLDSNTGQYSTPPPASLVPSGIDFSNLGPNVDLTPIAAQYGMTRDQLSLMRDAWAQDKLNTFRSQNGSGAAEDDLSAFSQMSGQSQLKNGGYVANPSMQNYMQSAISAAQGGGAGKASQDQYSINSPGFQFNDPYTKQLEDLATQMMGNLSKPQSNPGLDALLQNLNARINTLTTSPGYSPDDLALLRTQVLDPIEQDRAASQQRAMQRAAQGGYLPTSGITQLTGAPNGGTETYDQSYDRMRAAAQRDLGVKAIDKRTADLNQAIQYGQLAGLTIPQAQRTEDTQRRSEMLQLAQVLYNLPRQAMQDSLSVLNGSSNPNDLFSQAMQTQQQQQQQQQQDAARWAAIAQMIAGINF